jgi:hypothetical protein
MYSRDQPGSSPSPNRAHLRRPARRHPPAEQLGFGAFFRSNNYLAMGDVLRAAPQRRRRDARRGAREMERWAEAGAKRLYMQVLDLADLGHLDAIADLVS